MSQVSFIVEKKLLYYSIYCEIRVCKCLTEKNTLIYMPYNLVSMSFSFLRVFLICQNIEQIMDSSRSLNNVNQNIYDSAKAHRSSMKVSTYLKIYMYTSVNGN